MADPEPLIRESAEVIADLVFTPRADLPEGVERLPLKLIHSNHVPMVAPAATLRDADPARIHLDPERCMKHAKQLLAVLPAVRAKVLEVFARPAQDETPFSASSDPDLMLYSGGFFSPGDKHLMKKILGVPPRELHQHSWSFTDPRLPLMLFRFRARNYPDTLTAKERDAWDQDRVRRLIAPQDDRQFTLTEFVATIGDYRRQHSGDGRAQLILDQLESWVVETGLIRLAEEASPGLTAGPNPGRH
jgi:exodeoxyribonuclease-1